MTKNELFEISVKNFDEQRRKMYEAESLLAMLPDGFNYSHWSRFSIPEFATHYLGIEIESRFQAPDVWRKLSPIPLILAKKSAVPFMPFAVVLGQPIDPSTYEQIMPFYYFFSGESGAGIHKRQSNVNFYWQPLSGVRVFVSCLIKDDPAMIDEDGNPINFPDGKIELTLDVAAEAPPGFKMAASMRQYVVYWGLHEQNCVERLMTNAVDEFPDEIVM